MVCRLDGAMARAPGEERRGPGERTRQVRRPRTDGRWMGSGQCKLESIANPAAERDDRGDLVAH